MGDSEFRPMEGRMKTYAGEDRARHTAPPALLDGTQEAAQAYVDRITRSAWWRKNCKPSWLGDADRKRYFLDTSQSPRRIIVVATKGAGGRAGTNSVYKHRGKWFPRIRLGTAHRPDEWAKTDGWLGAIRDPYVILHEDAHIMAACDEGCGENGHGRWFRYYMVILVARWMGPEHARALKAGYEAESLKWRKPPRKG